MTSSAQPKSWTPNLSLRPATAALLMTVLLVLATVLAHPVQAQTFKVLHTFTGGTDGGLPVRGLTMDRAGNLYGTTVDGGYYGGDCANYGCGSAFKLVRSGSGWIFDTLYDFQGGYDGVHPSSRPVLGPDGSIYGTTYKGGMGTCDPYGDACGMVFKLTPPPVACKSALCGWNETVLYRFSGGSDGGSPSGDPIFDQAGSLYGTAENGGYGSGVVFKLTPSGGSWTESVLYAFPNNEQGPVFPGNGVIFDNAGNLIGVTEGGGGSYEGTLFELIPSQYGWNLSLLYQFNQLSGANPSGALVLDAAGNLYGTTSYEGASDCGTAYAFTASGGGWNFSVLYNFAGGSPSCGPLGGLITDTAGNLYGTTEATGAYQKGVVFKLTPTEGGWTYTSLHDFTGGADGSEPWSTLVLDVEGNLYGTTTIGAGQGCNGTGCGVVFEVTP
jgi:uncharacterized repeat protein (TIGR03803 family)